MTELSPQYNPKEVEDKWYRFWQEKNLFSAKANPDKKPFCIVIPPPNVTGILHMGHALNNTIQDILIRYHKMKDEETLWMPGTDHAGIATQNVVEKSIAKEGLRRQDLGREKFLERVWQWREQYGSTIINQLKKLGASCDWERTRFTMDEEYSKAVIEAFISLHNKKLIYKGRYMINWCPRCETALSDEEAPHCDIEGKLYYIKYPFKDKNVKLNKKNYIVVATTRPETMIGDTAVAINPKDKRSKELTHQIVVLPLMEREIPIISDDFVDQKFGTGLVKVTPAHDDNDYEIGLRNNLKFINILHPNAVLNENAGKYAGMDRFIAREAIVKDLEERKLIENIVPHKHAVGHCYRCHTVIEPYLSWQWFVEMRRLAKPAIEVVKKSRIKFIPKRWTKVYLNWMKDIRDWCISRQIWWGHRIPVWYCNDCYVEEKDSQPKLAKLFKNEDKPHEKHATVYIGKKVGERIYGAKGLIVSRGIPKECPDCHSANLRQDEDVLDTWFSSWLWPFATFYWPENRSQKTEDRGQKEEKSLSSDVCHLTSELEYFYPTSVLVTAPEIIFFWVARMIMAGLEFMQDIPFKDVYIHGTVRDIEGKKMSKSLGNIIDPLEIINEYGADALRFSLISITSHGQDVFLSKERFEQGRNFANKIWNASRFILMNLEPDKVKTDLCEFFKKEELSIINRWILSRFYSVFKKVNKLLDSYYFNEAVNTLYSFFWHEFCDWYLEMIKPDIKNRQNQVVMYKVLEKSLRVLHPFMPFISEEIWQRLPHEGDSIMISPWPHLQDEIIDKKIEAQMNMIFEIIQAIRNIRQELEILPQQKLNVVISTENKTNKKLIDAVSAQIKNLARLDTLNLKTKYTHTKSAITLVIKDIHISLLLEGLLDMEKERLKIKERIEKIKSSIQSKKRILNNKEFIKKAPQEVVEKEKTRIEELNAILKRLKVIENGLS